MSVGHLVIWIRQLSGTAWFLSNLRLLCSFIKLAFLHLHSSHVGKESSSFTVPRLTSREGDPKHKFSPRGSLEVH